MYDPKKQRELAGIGPREASRLVGVSESTLWRYEEGKTKRLDFNVIERMRVAYEPLIRQRHGDQPKAVGQ